MSKNVHALSPEAADWLAETFARNRATFGGWSMEVDGGGQPDGDKPDGDKDQTTFTQADVDRIVKERVQRERTKYADYDDLKKKAEGAQTAEERIGALEKEIESTKREAMRRRVQAAHGISDEDADLFLTGTDEDTLAAQAKRLADREAERKKKNNVSPREGTHQQSQEPDEMREFARNLFGRDA